MHNQSAKLIEEAWVLAFRLAWAAAVASGRRYERLMYAMVMRYGAGCGANDGLGITRTNRARDTLQAGEQTEHCRNTARSKFVKKTGTPAEFAYAP